MWDAYQGSAGSTLGNNPLVDEFENTPTSIEMATAQLSEAIYAGLFYDPNTLRQVVSSWEYSRQLAFLDFLRKKKAQEAASDANSCKKG